MCRANLTRCVQHTIRWLRGRGHYLDIDKLVNGKDPSKPFLCDWAARMLQKPGQHCCLAGGFRVLSKDDTSLNFTKCKEESLAVHEQGVWNTHIELTIELAMPCHAWGF